MFVPYKGMEEFFLLSLKLSGSSALVTLSNMQMSSREADESTQVQLTFTQIWPRSKVSLDIFKDTEDRWHILCSVLELQEGPHFTTIFIFSWLRFNHNDQITIEAIFFIHWVLEKYSFLVAKNRMLPNCIIMKNWLIQGFQPQIERAFCLKAWYILTLDQLKNRYERIYK